MNDRSGHHEDRLVYKSTEESGDEVNVPSQRAQAVSPEPREPLPGNTPAGHAGAPQRDPRGAGAPVGTAPLNAPPGVPAGDPHTGPVDRQDGPNGGPGGSLPDATDAGPLDRDPTPTVAGRTGPAHPAHAGSLFEQNSQEVRRRWQEVQTGFVDDPREAVERADSLVAEITGSLRAALEARTSELQARWKGDDRNDTEDLRTALRDYRALLEQLLDLSTGKR